MNGSDVALDTSAAILLLNDHQLAARFLSQAGQIHLPAVAAGELLFGAANSAKASTNLPRYREFIENCIVLPVSRDTAEVYAATRLKLKQQGSPIPDSDVWIAASSLEHRLPIVTKDKHFTHVLGLSVIAIP